MNTQIETWKTSGLIPPDEEPQWTYAATQFRLPYWDWARPDADTKQFGIPAICCLPTIKVVLPGGETTDYPNPLGIFQNPTTDSSGKPVPMGDVQYMGVNAITDNNTNKPPLPVSRKLRIIVSLLTIIVVE